LTDWSFGGSPHAPIVSHRGAHGLIGREPDAHAGNRCGVQRHPGQRSEHGDDDGGEHDDTGDVLQCATDHIPIRFLESFRAPQRAGLRQLGHDVLLDAARAADLLQQPLLLLGRVGAQHPQGVDAIEQEVLLFDGHLDWTIELSVRHAAETSPPRRGRIRESPAHGRLPTASPGDGRTSASGDRRTTKPDDSKRER
jgi:hypothetical protein